MHALRVFFGLRECVRRLTAEGDLNMPARHTRQIADHRLDFDQNGLRPRADFADDLRHDSLFLREQGGQQVGWLYHTIGGLYRQRLRFDDHLLGFGGVLIEIHR